MLTPHSNMASILQHHFPSSSTIQHVEEVKQLDNKQYREDEDKATSRIGAKVATGSIEHANFRCVHVKNSVGHILNLVNFDDGFHATVDGGVEASIVNGCTFIVSISLNDLVLLILIRGWKVGSGDGFTYSSNILFCFCYVKGSSLHIERIELHVIFHLKCERVRGRFQSSVTIAAQMATRSRPLSGKFLFVLLVHQSYVDTVCMNAQNGTHH